MIGLSEEEGGVLNDRVSVVVQSLGEKSRIEAVRVGVKKRTDLITFSSSAIVDQIVGNAKKLRQVGKFRNVFLISGKSSYIQ